jgi:hypothetical protein
MPPRISANISEKERKIVAKNLLISTVKYLHLTPMDSRKKDLH